ncbi:MAG: hypothetical protein ABL984_19375 [Pyrinomonadaceae bacterium]
MKTFLTIIILALSAVAISAQTAGNDPWPFPDRKRPAADDDSQMVKEMLAKQQSAREKKEYEELVERGEAALKLSSELETSFNKKEQLTETERKKLEEFEKLVSKIRDDLGGNDDEETALREKEKESPKDVREGFLYLKRSTTQLVSEIKRSTRFSVSILAIESSNTLIRLARFLRLKN